MKRFAQIAFLKALVITIVFDLVCMIFGINWIFMEKPKKVEYLMRVSALLFYDRGALLKP